MSRGLIRDLIRIAWQPEAHSPLAVTGVPCKQGVGVTKPLPYQAFTLYKAWGLSSLYLIKPFMGIIMKPLPYIKHGGQDGVPCV